MALREVIERIRSFDEPPNEEATKFQIVLPILRELDWDAFDATRVVPEYSVGSGKGSGRVDLALMAPRRGPLALIEVKTAGAKLDDHVVQVLGYAFNEGVDICVLTTGLKWWLYLPREKGPPVERRFAEFDVEADSVEQFVDDFETYLSYEALTARRSERHARQVLAARIDSERLSTELPRIWASLLDDPPQSLLDLIEQRVFNSTRLRPSHEQMSAFLAQRAAAVPESAPALPPAQVAQPSPSPATLESSPDAPSRRTRTPSVPPAAFTLWGQRREVDKWVEVWIGVAEALLELHGIAGFERAVGSPNGKRSYIDLEPAERLSSQRLANSGFYIGTHTGAAGSVQRARNLLEVFGHSPDDLQVESSMP